MGRFAGNNRQFTFGYLWGKIELIPYNVLIFINIPKKIPFLL